MAKNSAQKSYVKAIFFSIFLVLVFFIASNLSKFGSSKGSPQKITVIKKNNDITILEENQKDSLKRKNAGFWECNNASVVTVPCMHVTDRIELKTNGIYWRVQKNVIMLPDADSLLFTHIQTGYANPFSRSKTHPDSITCEVHIIGQAFVAGTDTCYGDGDIDTVWNIDANGATFGFDDRAYSKYDTTGQARFQFFPKGATKILEEISISKCSNQFTLEGFAKQSILKEFSKKTVPNCSNTEIMTIIDSYYKGLFALPIARWVTVNTKGSATVAFSVSNQGIVQNAKVTSIKPKNMKLETALEKEVSTWVFPSCTSAGAPTGIQFELSY